MGRATMGSRHLGQLLRAERRQLGITQAQMAARCGLSGKYFGQLERGDADASLSTLECLAQGLQMSAPDILGLITPQRRSNRPTLDLEKWLKIQEALRLLMDYTDQVISYAKAAGAGSRASRRDQRPPPTSRKKPLRSPKRQ
jgi:transcriptional regulator with XRE-family HTH domain